MKENFIKKYFDTRSGNFTGTNEKTFFFIIWLLMTFVATAAPAQIEFVQVRTRALENRTVTVYFRIPANYDPDQAGLSRVLILFGGRNTDGRADASGRLGWGEWADKYGIFLVCPGFRNDNYWEPEEWSGRALFSALAEIRKKYEICTDKLLFYGYSAGSQCSNLFPAWKPGNTRAWVSHACGVFHEPGGRMRSVPGLVTCGDADMARYIISRNFVEEARKKGAKIIWKSFPNSPHDVPPDSLKLARAFLSYYHILYLSDLRYSAPQQRMHSEVFVGDDLDHIFYPADSPQAQNILPEDRVILPDRSIAEAWGKEAK